MAASAERWPGRTGGWRGGNPRQSGHPGCWLPFTSAMQEGGSARPCRPRLASTWRSIPAQAGIRTSWRPQPRDAARPMELLTLEFGTGVRCSEADWQTLAARVVCLTRGGGQPPGRLEGGAPQGHPGSGGGGTTRGGWMRSGQQNWLIQHRSGPCRAGAGIVSAHPHKGSLFCVGGQLALNTADRSILTVPVQASHRGTLRSGGRNADEFETPDMVCGEALRPAAGDGWTGRTRTREGVAAGRPAGHAGQGHADGGHGSRERGGQALRPLLVPAGREAPRLTCWLPPAACLCSRGSDCTTRTGWSWFAGGWVRRTGNAGPWETFDGQGTCCRIARSTAKSRRFVCR